MNALRVAIVDDEPLARARLRRLLERSDGARVEVAVECTDGADLAAALARTPVDAVFLDIQMPEADGFAALARLPPPHPAIVFVTGFKQHAVRAFDVRATDYLLKPVSARRLAETLARLVQARDATPGATRAQPPAPAATAPPSYPQRLPLPLGQRRCLVPVDEIELVIAQRNYLEVQTRDRSFVLRQPLAAFAAGLDPQRFLQIHRSLIVRIGAVREIKALESARFRLTLDSGKQIRSGRHYRAAVRALLQAD